MSVTEAETRVRHLPWVACGTDVSGSESVGDALAIAGLDWDVRLEQLYRLPDKDDDPGASVVVVPDVFATVRCDTGDTLGVVRARYEAFPNRDAFAFVDGLLGGADLRYAGELRGGRTVYCAAKMKETLEVCGDEFDTYLVLRTTHDGSGSVSVTVMPVRVQCTNGMALTVPGAEQRWSVSHTAGMAERMEAAKETLGLAMDYQAEYREMCERLLQVRVSAERVGELIAETVPATWSDRFTSRLLTGVPELMESSTSIEDSVRETGWGAMNALTEWMDHGRGRRRTAESGLHSMLDGDSARLRNAFAARLLEVAA